MSLYVDLCGVLAEGLERPVAEGMLLGIPTGIELAMRHPEWAAALIHSLKTAHGPVYATIVEMAETAPIHCPVELTAVPQ